MNTPLALVILDGWGQAPAGSGNPISLASTPFWDVLINDYPSTTLFASGGAVGLPKGQCGNSEAGHMNLGAGRVVEQDSVIISKDIVRGSFFRNPSFLGAVERVKKNRSSLHCIGLLSGYQSPHMDPNHLEALILFAEKQGLKNVFLHLFTDGRDSYHYAGLEFLEKLIKEREKFVHVVTMMGRLYLDRKKNWKRSKAAWEAMVLGRGLKFKSAREAITQAYQRRQTDEFITPSVIVDQKGKPRGLIKDSDAVIFFNLRSDRARQLTKVFVQKDFTKKNPGSFKLAKVFSNLYFVAMTDFGPDLSKVITAYPSITIKETLPYCLSKLRQLYIAESEKYAHVTYFFNGGLAKPVAGEARESLPSPHVDSYASTPAMRVPDLTKKIISKLSSYDFICTNFSSPDMIGHTGDITAAIQAVQIVDDNLQKLAISLLKHNGTLIVTGDHGNIEEMIDKHTGEINTQHSFYPVSFIVFGKKFKGKKLKKISENKLADVAPSILDILNIKKPDSMTGRSLLLGA